MSLVAAWLWGILLVAGTVVLSVAGSLLVRRWATVEVLECHKEVAGFIYAVIGVLYAVLLGFTAIIVWERYEKAYTSVEQEANEVADLFRDAQVFPTDVRNELGSRLRTYVRLVLDNEWPAMAAGRSSRETWQAYNQLWPTYHRIEPQSEQEKAWYTLSLTRLNQLGDYRRLRLLSNRSAVPGVMWIALLGGGAVTVCFSFLFGTKHVAAQVVMTAGLAATIALLLFSILAMNQPFAGIMRVEPHAFHQVAEILDLRKQPEPNQSR
jgi:hypothetical protein